jgi:hypothetical protein
MKVVLGFSSQPQNTDGLIYREWLKVEGEGEFWKFEIRNAPRSCGPDAGRGRDTVRVEFCIGPPSLRTSRTRAELWRVANS